MDNTAKDNHFVFAIMVFLCLCLAIIAIFCGGEIMKKITASGGILLIVGIALIIILLLLNPKNWFFKNENELNSWGLVRNDNKKTVLKDKNIKKLMFDESITSISGIEVEKNKFLTDVEFYAENLIISDTSFSKCKNLSSVTFYHKPTTIIADAFSGCHNLKHVYLIGEQESFKGFSITVPENCTIEFKPVKTIEVKEIEKESTKNENKKDYNGSSKKGK